MAFDVTKPADTQTIALGPQDIRENFRALKDDKIVAAATAETSADAQAHINDTTDAHAGSAIGVTAAAYGRGLATTETTVQKVADRVNQNGTPQFVTDKSKCSLLLDFKDGLADKTRGIQPLSYNTAVKGSDNFISSPDGNISATLKQFDGDEGKFGSGIAVEESRTNLFTYSDDLTNVAWAKTNCTVTLDRVLPDGRKLFKVTATADGAVLGINFILSAIPYTMSAYILNPQGKRIDFKSESVTFKSNITQVNSLTRYSGTATPTAVAQTYYFCFVNVTSGDYFYITSPQLEAGAFPTSYIATGATAVTRPAGKLEYTDYSLNNSNIYSISLWFNPNYSYNQDSPSINPKGILEIGTKHWLTYHNTLKKFLFYTDNTNGTCISNAYASDIDFKKNHHIALVQNGATAFMYVDNVKYTVTGTASSLTASLINLGAVIGSSQANGTISNFAIFNYALSADEISNIYNAGLEGKPVICVNSLETAAVDRLTTVINATHAMTADSAITATSAASATNANHATTSDSATNAIHATSSDSATNANHATTSDSATNANHATTSDSATNADTLDNLHASAFALVGHTTHTGEAASLAQNGYKKFADGTIIQWGMDNMTSGYTSKTVFFPIAFPNACLSVMVIPYGPNTSSDGYFSAAGDYLSYFMAYHTTTQPGSIYWIAIGY